MRTTFTARQMARLNAMNEEAFAGYVNEGFLQPVAGTADTFDLLDSRLLDAMSHLEFIGVPVEDAHRANESGDLASLKEILEAAVARLAEERQRLEHAERLARTYLAECDGSLGNLVLNQIILEDLPARRGLALPLPKPLRTYGGGDDDAARWEMACRLVRQAIMQAGSDVSLFRHVGYIIEQKDFGEDAPPLSQAMVLTDHHGLADTGRLHEIELPAGHHLTMYVSHAYPQGSEGTGQALLKRMLDYAERVGYEVVGDYYEETLCRWYQAIDPNNDVLLHACLPVRRPH